MVINIEKIHQSLSLPLPWLEDRLQNITIAGSNSKEWVLVTEHKNPFCFILDESRIKIKEKEAVLMPFFDENPYMSLGVILHDADKYSAYTFNKLNRRIEQLRNPFDLFKLNDKSKLLKKGSTKDLAALPSQPEKFGNLIFQLHSALRDIDGLHPDSALDEICKILYVKLFDEESTKEGGYYKLQKNLYSTVEECASSTKLLYREANEYDNRVYSLKIPGYKRSRGVFDSDITLSAIATTKLVELLQDYSFSKSETDLKGRIFQNLISPVLRAGLGQFFTPPEIVNLMVNMIKPQQQDLIVDPFAGSGHFLTSSIQYVKNNTKISTKLFNEFLFSRLHGMEISERMVRISMTDMRLNGDGHSNIRCVDSLLDFQNYQDVHPESFDIVMTNPPFGSTINSENLAKYKHFCLAENRKSLPLEILGIERSIELLRVNGKIAIVLPDSILVNSNLNYVRQWILENIQIYALVSLPVETFSPFGANIKTSILFGRKINKVVDAESNEVFIADIKNVGYDAAGRKTKLSDIEDVLADFNLFIEKNNINWT